MTLYILKLYPKHNFIIKTKYQGSKDLKHPETNFRKLIALVFIQPVTKYVIIAFPDKSTYVILGLICCFLL